jgi:two-component system nitrogen regulation sensor histidine kinase NtrY
MIVSLKENRERILAAERIAAWQDVARAMAHEIKNPLWPIQLSVRSLRRSYKTDKENFDKIFDECTNTIINEVESLIHIIDEFRDFARMPKPQLKDCNINEVVRQTLSLYKGLPEGIEIATELENNLPVIKADAEQLSRAFLNIISNAVPAMPNGGKLLIHSLFFSAKKKE